MHTTFKFDNGHTVNIEYVGENLVRCTHLLTVLTCDNNDSLISFLSDVRMLPDISWERKNARVWAKEVKDGVLVITIYEGMFYPKVEANDLRVTDNPNKGYGTLRAAINRAEQIYGLK